MRRLELVRGMDREDEEGRIEVPVKNHPHR